MNQAVHIDMEVLQRIKFLMEYDVMKTSSENFLAEQTSMVKPKQNLAQPKTQTSQSLVGDRKTDWSKLPSMGSDPLHPKSAKWGDVPNVTLETVTQDVRKFMSDWKVASVETIMTYLGVGIPVVITANAFWMTLEIIQVQKGTPDWWSLVFSILATITAGSQAAWLKPLYKLGGKGAKNLFGALDQLYQYAKSMTGGNNIYGFADDLIALIKLIPDGLSKLMGILDEGIEWISKISPKMGQKGIEGIANVVVFLKDAKNWLSGIVKSIGDWVTKVMDKPLDKAGRQAGLDPETSRKLGGAVRWGSVPAGIVGGITGYNYFFGPPNLDSIPSRTLPYGSYLPPDSRQK